MLETSVLNKMTGSLCDEVVGGEFPESWMSSPVPTCSSLRSTSGWWYRYHHLFSDLLLYELKRSRPDPPARVARTGQCLVRGGGLFEDAIRHAMAASDYEMAGTLVARHWFRYAVTGQLASLERWLEALPAYLTNRDAPLVLVKAWMCAIYGRREERSAFCS